VETDSSRTFGRLGHESHNTHTHFSTNTHTDCDGRCDCAVSCDTVNKFVVGRSHLSGRPAVRITATCAAVTQTRMTTPASPFCIHIHHASARLFAPHTPHLHAHCRWSPSPAVRHDAISYRNVAIVCICALKIWFTNPPVGCRNEKHLSRLEESAMRRGGWPAVG
jgi:hypothetical protein